MIIKPRVESNICLNCHPVGCATVLRREIEYVEKALPGRKSGKGPKLALFIGCSTGYGLASRLAAAFGYGAATVGISLERPAAKRRPGSPGFYNDIIFDKEAARAGIASRSINGDAYSDETKAEAVKALREVAARQGIPAKLDLIIYSLASSRRLDPRSGTVYHSVIKPIGKACGGTVLDMITGKFSTSRREPATEEEIASTVKVMGGEDWEWWMDALDKEGLLSPQSRSLAYSYIGPEYSWPIYTGGTLGRAKQDLERAARDINTRYEAAGKIGHAWVSVNAAAVTRSSSVIPIMALYLACLFKVLKQKGLYEGCVEQMTRLFKEVLYSANPVPTDGEGRIRIDDRELRPDVQAEISALFSKINENNVFELSDAAGFKHNFLEINGFDVAGVDYDADIDPENTNLL
jgi:enoyl-[acyl-carrier protein] reductase/trans-2-enoyl-CoA reductase (NAD+)